MSMAIPNRTAPPPHASPKPARIRISRRGTTANMARGFGNTSRVSNQLQMSIPNNENASQTCSHAQSRVRDIGNRKTPCRMAAIRMRLTPTIMIELRPCIEPRRNKSGSSGGRHPAKVVRPVGHQEEFLTSPLDLSSAKYRLLKVADHLT